MNSPSAGYPDPVTMSEARPDHLPDGQEAQAQRQGLFTHSIIHLSSEFRRVMLLLQHHDLNLQLRIWRSGSDKRTTTDLLIS